MLKRLLGGLAVDRRRRRRRRAGAGRKAEVAADAPPATPETGNLNKTDVDAWLDGFMPYALQRGDVAGAVVLVVKDGQILTPQKGYGYADLKSKRKVDRKPRCSARIDVEAVHLDLDHAARRAGQDRSRRRCEHLSRFQDPAYQGKPITMRQIMSHAAGFEEASGGLIVDAPFQYPALGVKLKRWIPARIFPPGTTPAYSNYATGLAGYVGTGERPAIRRLSGRAYLPSAGHEPHDDAPAAARQSRGADGHWI